MSLAGRIDALERRSGAEPWRPWVYLDQDQADPDLWHAAGGGDYHELQLDQLAEEYRLILVAAHGGAT